MKSEGAAIDCINIQYYYFASSMYKPSDCAVGLFASRALEISGWKEDKNARCCHWDQSIQSEQSIDGKIPHEQKDCKFQGFVC